jgi:S1-C subfamily serine protease
MLQYARLRTATSIGGMLLAVSCFASLQVWATEGAVKALSLDSALPSVVVVKTDFAAGAGFVCGSNEWVATCLHVVSGAKDISVTLNDDQTVKVDGYCAADESKDVVLLHLEKPVDRNPLTIAPIAPSVGTEVFAIGNPRGLGGTVSKGIVSAIRTGLQVKKLDNGPFTKRIMKDEERWVQFDAPIQRGSSGGPLVTGAGDVVGVVSHGVFTQDINFATSVVDLAVLVARPSDLKPKPLSRMKEDTPRLVEVVGEMVSVAIQTKNMWLDGDREIAQLGAALAYADDRMKEIDTEDERRRAWVQKKYQDDAFRRRLETERCFDRLLVKLQTVFLAQLVASDGILLHQKLFNAIYPAADRECVEAMEAVFNAARAYRLAVWEQHRLCWDFVNADEDKQRSDVVEKSRVKWRDIRDRKDRLFEAVKSFRKLKAPLEERFLISFDPPTPVDEATQSQNPDAKELE